MAEIKFFDKALTIKDLENTPIGQPIGLIYTTEFGIPASDLINYVQSLGGISSLSISPLIPLKDKQEIIKNYLSYGEYINSPTLFDVCLTLFKSFKKVNEDVLESTFLTFSDIIYLTNVFNKELKSIDEFFSSLFYMMYFMSSLKVNDCSLTKPYYPNNFISDKKIPDFFLHLLKYPYIYDLYKLGISDNPIFYTDLYIRKKDIINCLIISDNNYILKTLSVLKTNKKLSELFKKKIKKNQ